MCFVVTLRRLLSVVEVLFVVLCVLLLLGRVSCSYALLLGTFERLPSPPSKKTSSGEPQDRKVRQFLFCLCLVFVFNLVCLFFGWFQIVLCRGYWWCFFVCLVGFMLWAFVLLVWNSCVCFGGLWCCYFMLQFVWIICFGELGNHLFRLLLLSHCFFWLWFLGGCCCVWKFGNCHSLLQKRKLI